MTPQRITDSLQLLAGLIGMANDAHTVAEPWAVLAWTEKIRDEAEELAAELLDDLRREMQIAEAAARESRY